MRGGADRLEIRLGWSCGSAGARCGHGRAPPVCSNISTVVADRRRDVVAAPRDRASVAGDEWWFSQIAHGTADMRTLNPESH